jgi:hypothetical protein
MADGGPPRCPVCRRNLEFECDRYGRTVERCGCGHRAYVLVRNGKPAGEQSLA